jgi:hypothetical protein
MYVPPHRRGNAKACDETKRTALHLKQKIIISDEECRNVVKSASECSADSSYTSIVQQSDEKTGQSEIKKESLRDELLEGKCKDDDSKEAQKICSNKIGHNEVSNTSEAVMSMSVLRESLPNTSEHEYLMKCSLIVTVNVNALKDLQEFTRSTLLQPYTNKGGFIHWLSSDMALVVFPKTAQARSALYSRHCSSISVISLEEYDTTDKPSILKGVNFISITFHLNSSLMLFHYIF